MNRLPRLPVPALVSALCLFVLLLPPLSCRSGEIEGDEETASLSVNLSGLLPAKEPSSGDDRAIFASSSSVTASVFRESDMPYGNATLPLVSKRVSVRNTSSLILSGLPEHEALTLIVTVRDASGASLSSATVPGLLLSAGSNPVSMTLLPSSTPQALTVTSAAVMNLDTATLAYGKTALYTMTFGTAFTVPADCQILVNTGRASKLQVQLFDEDWIPIDPLLSGSGWAVFTANAGLTVNVAVSNTLSSTDYPAASLSAVLQTRPCSYISPTASGGGTGSRGSPYALSEVASSGLTGSAFLMAGNYSLTSTAVQVTGDLRLYGGRDSSWAKTSSLSTILSTAPGLLTITGGQGAAENLSFDGSSCSTSTSLATMVHIASTVAPSTGSTAPTMGFVFENCVIQGPHAATSLSSLSLYGINLVSGSVELSGCQVSAGGATSASFSSILLNAVRLEGGSAYIHGSVIDGGYAVGSGSSGSAQVCAVYVATSDANGLVLARSKIWGGVASLTTILNSPSVCAVSIESVTQSARITGSEISGGLALSSGSTANTVAISVNPAAGSTIVIAGNTIETGWANDSSSGNAFVLTAVPSSGSPGATFSCIGNICLASDISKPFVLVNSATTGLLLQGNLFAGLPYISYDSYVVVSYAASDAGGTFLSYMDAVTELPVYLAAYRCITELPADPSGVYASWLDGNNWKPASLASSYLAGNWGSYTFDAVFSGTFDTNTRFWPALFLDRSGTARSVSGNWRRGAYE